MRELIGWLSIYIFLAAAVGLCLGIYQAMKDRDPRPKATPMTDDQAALQGIYRKNDDEKVKRMKSTRVADQKIYEYITWPAMCWEQRRREMAKYMAKL